MGILTRYCVPIKEITSRTIGETRPNKSGRNRITLLRRDIFHYMNSMTTDDQTIQFSVEDHCGRIIINRPKALNALSGEMCHEMNLQLMAWAHDDAISHVVISAVEGKAFCAGGDVRALIPMLKENHAHAKAYFETEYQLDLIINTFPKPVISIANGLTMGGGAGVLMNAAFQIITDRMDFAMPETAIGLFPDVAASVFLRRAPHPVASFLGITGWRIGAGDMHALGILSPETGFVVDSNAIDAVTAAVVGLQTPDQAAIKSAIISLTKYFAQYYKKSGIRVNAISPGGILDGQSKTFLDRYNSHCASKGMLDPEDVAKTAAFLISDQAAYVNGQNLIIDDGFSL